jgi:XTP/dITP diphosphohydrolase
MTKILIGTTNPAKREKLSWLFDDCDSFELVSVDDANLNLNIEENGNNFEENAIIKALAYSSAFDGYAVSSDGGATIPVLGNNWNELLTHRFAGNDATEIDRLNLMVKMMAPYENEDRLVLWNEAIALAYKGKLLFSFLQSGEKGYLQKEYNKDSIMPGFWLANLWFCPSFGKTYSELTEEQRRHDDFTWSKVKEKFITLLRKANL